MINNPDKPKILAIGSPVMLRRLSAKTENGQFEITGCPDPAAAAAIMASAEFDIVIVDNLVGNTDSVCRRVAEEGTTPVALMLQEKPVDWRALNSPAVDGYLADAGSNAEFTARLRAFVRRKLTLCH
jgi:DNA-binding response OmpR family regulator